MTVRHVVALPGLDGTGALFDWFATTAPPDVYVDIVKLPPEPLGYAKLAERLAPTLCLTANTIIVAESFSGPLAIMLAERHPVAALVLCNSFATKPRPRTLTLLAIAPFFRATPPAAIIRQFFVGPHASDAFVAKVRAAIAATPASVLSSRVRSALTVDVRAQLARCTMPILYLRGTEDRIVPDASVDVIIAAATVPVTVVRMPEPHLLLQTAPTAAWRAIHDVVLEPQQ